MQSYFLTSQPQKGENNTPEGPLTLSEIPGGQPELRSGGFYCRTWGFELLGKGGPSTPVKSNLKAMLHHLHASLMLS